MSIYLMRDETHSLFNLSFIIIIFEIFFVEIDALKNMYRKKLRP